MRRSGLLIACTLACVAPAGLATPRSLAGQQEGGCRVFVLLERDGAVDLELIALAENEMQVLDADDVITIVAPVSAGTSGDLVQRGQGSRMPIVRCGGGELRIMFQAPDGSRRDYPGVRMAELSGYDIRVNVTGAGLQRAFRIRGYEAVEADDGPVLDLFGGRIPLGERDYSITTETKVREALEAVRGSARLEYDNLLFANGRFPDGSEAFVIVDFGAGGTVVAQQFLPAGVEVSEVVAVEYSAEGERRRRAEMQGAGGTVSGFLGNATLPSLQVGDIRFDEPVVRVLAELPPFFGREVGAILGLDLLSRGGVVSIGYGADGDAYLELSAAGRGSEAAAELSFSLAANHIFVDGAINDEPVTFMLDTGARGSIVSRSLADRAGLSMIEGEPNQLRGLDGTPLEVRRATAEGIGLAQHAFQSVSFYVADLAALTSLGLGQEKSAVIGNDFLQQFDRIEVDFARRVIRLFD